jgi:oxygen-independent coproporphyrinogen-3 oxidase
MKGRCGMLDFSKLRDVLGDDSFLYVNYPFCPSFCRYCIYKLHKYTKADSDEFLKYYQREILLLAEKLNGFKFKNVHIGGGTPNLVDPELIIKPLQKLADFDEVSRFVVEIFPRQGLDECLKKLKKYHITKIQLGVQTLNEDLLKQENRATSKQTVMQCIAALSKSRLIWSLDLIYGFDHEDKFQRDYVSELKTLLQYHPSGFHLYTVRSERINKFYGMDHIKNKKLFSYRKTMGDLHDFMNVQKILMKRGYQLIYDEFCIGSNIRHAQRAISFNAKTGVFPNIIGIGLGAYSHTRVMRYRNVKNLKDYASLLDKKMLPIGQSSDFSKNHLYPISMIYNQIRKGANFDLVNFSRSTHLSDQEKMGIQDLLAYLDRQGVEYQLNNGLLTIPPSQYSLSQYSINEYVKKKSRGRYSLILD